MQFRKLLSEDDAVSPVIGVILMVAITVILAAVIASFVLGLGGSADEVQPTTSFDLEYDAVNDKDFNEFDTDYAEEPTQLDLGDTNNGTLSITVSSGESVSVDELIVRGDGIVPQDASDIGEGDLVDELVVSELELGDTEEFSSGEGFTIAVSSEFDISLVWEALDSDDSATLAERSGPDA